MIITPEANHIREYAQTLTQELLVWRHHLHSHPELSFREKETRKYIRKILVENGIRDIREVANTGLLAAIPGKTTAGPVIVLRADMDALPVTEENDTPYVSVKPGVMHACGHDVHMTCVLGSMKILQHFRNWNGTIYMLFQPAEEKLPGGAKEIVESGILEQINPSLIIGQHVEPEMDRGKAGYREGIYMASSDEIYITIKGQGGHAALTGSNTPAPLAAADTILSITKAIKQNQPAKIPTVIAFGKIAADGATNVIPARVTIEGTFRTFNESWRKRAHQIIADKTEEIARKYGAESETEIRHGYPVLINQPEPVQMARLFSSRYFGKANVIPLDIRMTSEDFAWYSQHFPSLFFRLGVKTPEDKVIRKLHTPLFDIDERTLPDGAGHLAWLAINFLNTFQ